MNPQHTIPLIVDEDGTIVYDSHAIIIYLVSKYAKDDSLYPEDIATRAKINAALHFDSGVLFARLRFYLVSVITFWSICSEIDKLSITKCRNLSCTTEARTPRRTRSTTRARRTSC